MNPEEAAFLAKICAEPGDDTHRLVYADWLQEIGQDKRAEFIRAQVEREAACRSGVQQNVINTERVRLRALELFQKYSQAWFMSHGLAVSVHRAKYREYGNHPPYRAGLVSRGFIDEITCPADDWLTHGDVIRAQNPITQVRLVTSPVRHEHELATWITGGKKAHLWSNLAIASGIGAPPKPPNEEINRRILQVEWPGVTFELPA